MKYLKKIRHKEQKDKWRKAEKRRITLASKKKTKSLYKKARTYVGVKKERAKNDEWGDKRSMPKDASAERKTKKRCIGHRVTKGFEEMRYRE